MQENFGANLLPFWIGEKDKRGNRVREDVVAAAQRIWSRILYDVERKGQDSAPAANDLGKTCRIVSRLLRRIKKPDQIEDLDAYLYWSFVRRYNKRMARERRVKYVGSVAALDGRREPDHSWVSLLHDEILLNQFLSYLNPKIRVMLICRLRADSWREIGAMFGITAHNAEVQFWRAIKRARKRMFGEDSDGGGRGSR